MRDQSTKTLGLPVRLGIGVLASTSASSELFGAPGRLGYGAMGHATLATATIGSTTDTIAADDGSSRDVEGAGYMVTSAGKRAA